MTEPTTEAQERRQAAVEAFLASQRRPVPESTPEAPQRSQEGS